VSEPRILTLRDAYAVVSEDALDDYINSDECECEGRCECEKEGSE